MTKEDMLDRTLRPATFKDFVGQGELVDRLMVKINSALVDDRPIDPILFDGPPGSGKTTLGDIIAAALDDKILAVTKPLSDDELLECAWELQAGILMVDELQRWSRSQQGALLTLIEEHKIATSYGPEEFPYITVIAATTEPDKIDPAILDRFDIVRFAAYTDADCGQIVRFMARKCGVRLDAATIEALGVAAAGVPRTARKLVLTARDLRSAGRHATAADILTFMQIEDDGLTRPHLDYLRVLHEFGGRAGLENLSTRLRMHPTIVREIERLLLDRRLVALDPRGRQLTHPGRDRFLGKEARTSGRAERRAS